MPSAFPANWDISCSAVLKLLLIWKKTVSPMEILSRPLVVIPIKHQKKQKKTEKTRKHNGSLEQMVKICNQSLIVTWLLVLLFWKCCSLISLKKKRKMKRIQICPQQPQTHSVSTLPYLSQVFPVSGYILLIISTNFAHSRSGLGALHSGLGSLMSRHFFPPSCCR